ncbi:MAG: transposase [Sedimentisphaerales bacterium]|nr:transposase [Sedimentisphaerales bacterium]
MITKDIGKLRQYATKILRTHGLTPLRNILRPDIFQSILPVHPRSSTVLVPEVVFWLMATVALGDGAMAGAVASFWATLHSALPYLPVTFKVRVLHYQMSGFRPSWLMTSLLDTETYSYDEIVTLYHERWRHETIYREWKHTLQINNLRSHTASGIIKEVLVQLTLNNVIRWIMAEAAGEQRRPVELQFRTSKQLIMASIMSMAMARTQDLPCLYRHLLEAIAGQVIRVRPGRRYPRRFDASPRNKGHGKVAMPSKLDLCKKNKHVFI